MKFRIHFTVNGHEDSVVLSGDTVEDIRAQWKEYAQDKPTEDAWSEKI